MSENADKLRMQQLRTRRKSHASREHVNHVTRAGVKRPELCDRHPRRAAL